MNSTMTTLPNPEEVTIAAALSAGDELALVNVRALIQLIKSDLRLGTLHDVIQKWCGLPRTPDLTDPFYSVSDEVMAEHGIFFNEGSEVSFFSFAALPQNGKLHVHEWTMNTIILLTDGLIEYAVLPQTATRQSDLGKRGWQPWPFLDMKIFPRCIPHASRCDDPLQWGLAFEIRPTPLPDDDETDDTCILPD